MRPIASLLGLALALVAGCAAQHDVPLEIVGLDRGRPQGFGCRAPSTTGGGPLLTELVTPRLAPCAMSCATGMCRTQAYVFDFIEVGGVPSCRGASLVDWCGEPGRCRVATRRCFDVDACVSSSPGGTAGSVLAGLRAASGGVILDSPPTATLLVRVVGSAQACADITSAGIQRDDVFGCAYSCPVQLMAVDGPLQLDLDALDDECGTLAYGCALFVSGERPVAP
jgi:hypothetical protein